jgi:type VI secretion system protein ImpJ
MSAPAQILPAPIQWHEGMLLLPQHFQQLDIRTQQLLRYHLSQLTPFYWGVDSLQFDEALLTNGNCRLLAFRGVLPDGTLIDALPASTPFLEIDLKQETDQLQGGPLYIYLCLPEMKGDSSDILGQLPRFRSVEGLDVVDVNTGDTPVSIPRLELRLELIAGKSPPPKYVTLPLARIKYDGKIFSFDTYQPPILSVTPNTLLWNLCDKIPTNIRGKLSYIQQKLQSIGQNPNLVTTQHELDSIRVQLLSSLLEFEAISQVNKVHPFSLYCELCSIAGAVSGISRDNMPPRFMAYNHDDALSNFSEAIAYIQRILNEVRESYSTLAFSKDDRIFSIQLRSDWSSDEIFIGIQAAPHIPQDKVIGWINNAVIASQKNIEVIRESRILGASRKIIASAPSLDLVPPVGITLVEVANDPNFIDFKDTLQIFNISDNDSERPLEIFLYRPGQET